MVLQSCVLFWSLVNGISPSLTSAVISVESSGNVMAIGQTHKEVGLMQIRPEFSKYTKLQLGQSCTNIMAGTEILGKLKKKCKMCVDKAWVNWYNLGETKGRKLKHPLKFKYSRKIAAVMGEK